MPILSRSVRGRVNSARRACTARERECGLEVVVVVVVVVGGGGAAGCEESWRCSRGRCAMRVEAMVCVCVSRQRGFAGEGAEERRRELGLVEWSGVEW